MKELKIFKSLSFTRKGDTLKSYNAVYNKEIVSELFSDKRIDFSEVFLKYPAKVPSSNKRSTRTLRAAKTTSVGFFTLQSEYLKKVTTLEQHLQVLECLDRELAERTSARSLPFMQGMSVWINQSVWEKYEIDDASTAEDSTTRDVIAENHGEDL